MEKLPEECKGGHQDWWWGKHVGKGEKYKNTCESAGGSTGWTWHRKAGTFVGNLTMIGFAFACLPPLPWSVDLWQTAIGSPLDAIDSVGGIGLDLGGGERDLSVEVCPAFPPMVVDARRN